EEVERLVEAPELGVVVLDVARRELRDLLDLHVVDHRGEDLLPRAVPEADGDPDDLIALVLAAFVPKPDRRRLAATLELVDENRRVEVECIDAASHRGSSVSDIKHPPR